MKEKTPPNPVTEAALRRRMKDEVAGQYSSQHVLLSAETIGLACSVTGIRDPAAAIDELVQDALSRWARLQVLEYSLQQDEPLETKLDKSATKRSRSAKAQGEPNRPIGNKGNRSR